MTGWLIWLGFGLFILILRNDQKIETWWRRCNLVGRKNKPDPLWSQRREWNEGKQVTFMEPVPSPVVKVASKPFSTSLADMVGLYEAMTPMERRHFMNSLSPALSEQFRDYERHMAPARRPFSTSLGRGIRNPAGYD